MTAPTPWHAPRAAGPVHATVDVPGSKSITNRALVLATLAGSGTVRGALRSRDSELMTGALSALGAQIGWSGHDVVIEVPDRLRGGVTVDCGLAGTVMRFVPPLAALADGDVRFDGDERARERPMSTMLDALRGLGCVVDGDRLPFVVRGNGGLPGGQVTVDASASSQFVSGLLLSGAAYDCGVTVHHESAAGAEVPSMPHIDMTVQMLRGAGVTVDYATPETWRVHPGPVAAVDHLVEPDLSNATVFLAAAAVTAGEVRVPGWPTETTQAGDAIRPILAGMGCTVHIDDTGLTVRGPDRLQGIDIDLHDVGELSPTVAALATLAEGPSTLRGIAHLRGHETDRISALATEIDAIGGRVCETADGLRIQPRRLRADPARPWRSYADHRMATAGAIVGLVVPDVYVDDIATTSKTLPDFANQWTAMLGADR